MIELSVSSLIAPVITSVISVISIYVAFSNRLSVLETKVDTLGKSVEKHNSVMERTFKLESDTGTMWKRYDELKERVERMEDHNS